MSSFQLSSVQISSFQMSQFRMLPRSVCLKVLPMSYFQMS